VPRDDTWSHVDTSNDAETITQEHGNPADFSPWGNSANARRMVPPCLPRQDRSQPARRTAPHRPVASAGSTDWMRTSWRETDARWTSEPRRAPGKDAAPNSAP